MKRIILFMLSAFALLACGSNQKAGILKEDLTFPFGNRLPSPPFTGEAYLQPLIQPDTARPAPVGRQPRTAAKAGATYSFARATAFSWWTSPVAALPVLQNSSSMTPAMWTATSSRWANRPGTRTSVSAGWRRSATKAPSSRKGPML